MRMKTISVVLVLFLSGCSFFHVYQDTPSHILKSANDHRDYQYITLDNNLKVLLISDPYTDVSAASMDVKVGSGDDPLERPGLAHFLEHMLFLGTEKYPEAGEYQKFIKDNAGQHNAYTSFEHTNYYFSVRPSALDQGLDRFSQFFIAPLFHEEYVEREKQAVHSEYQARLKNEARRVNDVLKEVVNQKHPYSKFSIGSLETLSSSERPIRDDLLTFYSKHYAANNMALVVLGKESLSQLEEMVRERFSKIPDYEVKPNQDKALPLFEETPKLVLVKPEKKLRSLKILFAMPDYLETYHIKPMSPVSHVLGDEGKNSLLSYLKERNLAEALSTGYVMNYDGGSMFAIDVSLTENGLSSYNEVIEAIFTTIHMMKAQGVPKYLYDEMALLSEIAFNYAEPASPQHYVTRLSSNMHYYPKELVLASDTVYQGYDEELIQQRLGLLDFENALMILVTDDFEPDHVSQYHHVPYKVTTLEKPVINGISEKIKLPVENEFLPEDLNLVVMDAALEKPVNIKDEPGVEYWYKGVDEFQLPKASAFYSFQKEEVHKTPGSSVLLALYALMLNDSLAELTYPAYLAGMNFNLYAHTRGVSLKIEGFSDKQESLLRKIITIIDDPGFSEEQFSRVKSAYALDLENSGKSVPYKRLLSEAARMLGKDLWAADEKLAALDKISLQDLKDYAKGFWKQAELTTLFNGNLTREDALLMGRKVQQMLELKELELPLPVKDLKGLHLEQTVDTQHPDSAYVRYWQGENNSPKEKALWNLLASFLEADFYSELRTEKQLGYVVALIYYPLYDFPGMMFLVQSPSNNESQIHGHVEAFLGDIEDKLKRLTEEEFEQLKSALIESLQQEPKSLAEESSIYWYDLALGYFDFDRDEQVIESLQALTLESWRGEWKSRLSSEKPGEVIFHTGELKDGKYGQFIPGSWDESGNYYFMQ